MLFGQTVLLSASKQAGFWVKESLEFITDCGFFRIKNDKLRKDGYNYGEQQEVACT